MNVRVMTNRDADFYALVGPLLARREIEKETGGRLYDDDGKLWFVAIEHGNVVGLCAAQQRRRTVTLCGAYVRPEHRRKGVYRELFAARERLYARSVRRAVCTPASLPTFIAAGYAVVRLRGRFTEVTKWTT